MNSFRHRSTTGPLKQVARPWSMLAMISRGLAKRDGAQHENERRVRERLEQLARLEQWELDRRVREVGEW